MKHNTYTQYTKIILLFLVIFNCNITLAEENPDPSNNGYPEQSDSSDLKDYAEHLRTCTAGNFNVLNPMTKTSMQYQIVGLKNNKCEVIQTIKLPNTNPPQNFVLHCLFEQNDLKMIVKNAEKSTNAKGNTITIDINDPSSKIISNSCNPVGVEMNDTLNAMPPTNSE